MKIHRSTGYVHIDLSGAEAAVLLEELETVRGGSKFPKIRQACEGLRSSLAAHAALTAPKINRHRSMAKVVLLCSSLFENQVSAADIGIDECED